MGSAGEGRDIGFSIKKMFSLIKNSRQDSGGISTLKDKENNTLHSDNVEKATNDFSLFFHGYLHLG